MTYIDTARKVKNGKVYERHLLRRAYREDGKVKHETIANISSCSAEEIKAMKLALKHKHDLSALCSVKETVTLSQGMSVGAVWVLYQAAKRVGIEKALGNNREGKLALWQVIARLINQGSRLSAVRLAREHACCDILGLDAFNEEDLYENLDWISENQTTIEKRVFNYRTEGKRVGLFLYDVTSSYLEGEHNELGDYGYNRDKKRGKKQVVIGLLCDDEGVPVSVETFSGNTSDQATFFNQVNKLVKRFGCERVTMVGDRGMIKSAQVEAIEKAGFHYITAITKAEIESLVKRDIIQMDCFEDKLFEAVDGDIRYVLRRNPVRAEEMKEIRLDKKAKIERMVETKNEYLSEHPKAQVEVALRDVKTRINKLYVSRWLKVISKGRELYLDKDEAALSEESRYDGCYVLKTDLSSDVASKDVIHDRYKDLGEVESSFRIIKSTHLEVRPIHVRLKDHTRAHVFVVMLAYMIRQELKRCWEKMNITVKEGIANLSSVCGTAIMINNVPFCYKIPLPRDTVKELLDSAKITLPDVLPTKGIKVTTKNKTRIMR